MVKRERLLFLLKITISFGLLIILFWIMRKDIAGIVKILKNSNRLLFIAALSISAPLSILLSYRLKLLMEGQNISLLMKDAIYLTFVGYFFNNFMPTAIGGDIVKAHYASKKTNNRLISYTVVLSDRLVGVFATLFVAIIGMLFVGKTFKDIKIIYSVFFAFAASIPLAYFLLKKGTGNAEPCISERAALKDKIRNMICRLYAAIAIYKNNPLLIIKAFSLSVFLQAVAITSIYFFVLCLGGNINLLKLFLIVPIVWTVSMLPSLNGLGVREGAFVYFLKGDIGPEMGFAVSLLWLATTIINSVIGGIFHLCYPLEGGGKK